MDVLGLTAVLGAAVTQTQDLHGAAFLGAVAEDKAAVDVLLDGIPVAGLARGRAGPVVLVGGLAVGEDEEGAHVLGVAFLVLLQELGEVFGGSIHRRSLGGTGELTIEGIHV